jgi:putative copper export protein
MYEFAYVFHITGIAVWIGSFIGFAVLMRSVASKGEIHKTEEGIIRKIVRFVNTGVLPASGIVLVSGVYMILQFNRETLPLYLSLMEQAGSMAVLFTMLGVGLYSRRVTKKLEEGGAAAAAGTYSVLLMLSAGLALIVVIITGLRLV